MWLEPASSEGHLIHVDKGKSPKSLVCVPDTSPPRDVWPRFLCKVDHNDSLHVNTSTFTAIPAPLHYVCPSAQKQCGELWSLPVILKKEKKDDLLLPGSFSLLILSSWFLAMQYPPERRFTTPYTPHRCVLRYYRALLCYKHWTLLCRTRDLICEGLLFCANNVWNDRVVLVRVRLTHMSILGDIYFCFPIPLYIYWHSRVM